MTIRSCSSKVEFQNHKNPKRPRRLKLWLWPIPHEAHPSQHLNSYLNTKRHVLAIICVLKGYLMSWYALFERPNGHWKLSCGSDKWAQGEGSHPATRKDIPYIHGQTGFSTRVERGGNGPELTSLLWSQAVLSLCGAHNPSFQGPFNPDAQPGVNPLSLQPEFNF